MEIFANFGIVKTSASGILTDLFREVQGDLFPSVTLIQYSRELNYRENKYMMSRDTTKDTSSMHMHV
jgi:hypothetical protein